MPTSWPLAIAEIALTIAVIVSTAFTIFIITLPPAYSPFDTSELREEDFTDEDKQGPSRSHYDYFNKHKDKNGKLTINATVQVVVLGDVGRSPRMQNHALSIATHGGRVDLVGYVESDVHPDIEASRLINVVPIKPFPRQLQSGNRLVFLLIAPLKVAWQIWSLYYALCYRSKAARWMLVQNPPSIPTLLVARAVCFFRRTRLVIDWHNFGYSILALRLGKDHPLVKLSAWSESYFSRGATAHFAVSNAMVRVLKEQCHVKAVPLYDRPPKHFQPLSKSEKSTFLHRMPETAKYAVGIEQRTWRLVISSTSWTADEDFSLFLEALVEYSASANTAVLPKVLVIITGKGPQKVFYLAQIRQLNIEKKLENVVVATAWLSTEDYAALLGTADLGVSLHTSSSGVDLPMKVVDMFGTGLPVTGWSKFEAWPELVQEGKNGCGFESAQGLAEVLRSLFGGDGRQLEQLRAGAMEECKRRWEDEWFPVAGKLFELEP